MLDQGNSVSKCILKWWVTLNLGATLFHIYSTIEIGSLGHYTNLALKALCNFASELLTKSKCSKLLNSVAKISISCFIQYSWPVSLANGTLADVCSYFDFCINSFLNASVLFSASSLL